jgi:hypothetical protein
VVALLLLLALHLCLQGQKYAAAQQQALESLRSASDDTTSADGAAPDAKKQRGAVQLNIRLELPLQPMNCTLFYEFQKQCSAAASKCCAQEATHQLVSPVWLEHAFLQQ